MSSEWEQRMLCPDGACVGVIGPDGTCKVCGRAAPNWGDERRRGQRPTAEVEKELEAKISTHDLTAAPDDFDSRQLCPDGACIGVIGDDGACRVCGRRLDDAGADGDEDDGVEDEHEDGEDDGEDDDAAGEDADEADAGDRAAGPKA